MTEGLKYTVSQEAKNLDLWPIATKFWSELAAEEEVAARGACGLGTQM